MPDNDNSSPPLVTPKPTPASSAWRNPWLFIALATLVLAGWQWLETRQQLAGMQEQVARRLAEAEAGNQEGLGARKQLLAQVHDLQAKLGAVEGKLAEFQGQTNPCTRFSGSDAQPQEASRSKSNSLTLAEQQRNWPAPPVASSPCSPRMPLARLDRPQYRPCEGAVQ